MGLFSFSISFSIKYEKVILQISQDHLFELDLGELKIDFSHNIRKKQSREKILELQCKAIFKPITNYFPNLKKSDRLEIHIRSNETTLF